MEKGGIRTVVISAVNLRKGGTLTILRQFLKDYSDKPLKVIALVHKRELCDYPGIEYIEMPWCIKSWAHRLWAEYVTMKKISRDLAQRFGEPVDLWLSLHDTTPNVIAKRQEVYCHTSFPFLKLKARDWFMDPKIPIFSIMGRLYYRINVHRNDAIMVQQQWFADAMGRMLGVPREKFRICPPAMPVIPEIHGVSEDCDSKFGRTPTRFDGSTPKFLYVSTADCHKNFETLCEAARLVEKRIDKDFRVVITVKGDENRYARWLYKKWGGVKSIDFHGLMGKEELFRSYADADVFVFPSRIETWGLPISEYMAANPKGGLFLADLPYAHETSGGRGLYFPPTDAEALSKLIYEHLMNHENTAIR